MTEQRLWIVSELYYPEETSTGYFLTRIAEGLAPHYDVRVICGQPTYSEHRIRAARCEERNGVHINRLRSTHFGKDRLVLRAVNILTLTWAATWFALINFRRRDRILIVTNPPTLPLPIGLIARWKKMRSHLLVHDVYPDILAVTGVLRSSGLPYRMLDRMFCLIFQLYGSVIVLGRDMAEVVTAKLGDSGAKLSIITNWGDVDEVVPVARDANIFLKINELKAPCIIQFSGNIGRTHDIDIILKAADRLKGRNWHPVRIRWIWW